MDPIASIALGPTGAGLFGDNQLGPSAKLSIETSPRVAGRAETALRTMAPQGLLSPMAKRRSDSERRARQSQRIGRALRLLCLIQDRHSRWDLPSLARELGCSTKTIQRDLLALEDAHIPFFYDKQACCYKIRPGFRLSILDGPSNQTSRGEEDAQTPQAPNPSTPIELAESSKEHAERLLSEAEHLVEKLVQLCQSLRQSADPFTQ